MISLSGKVVMITGAFGGLGRTVTEAFTKAGAKVVVVSRELPEKLPEGLVGISADVTEEAEVQQLMTEAMRKTARIDCLINLVGGFAMSRLSETEASVWSRMLSLNLTSAFLLVKRSDSPYDKTRLWSNYPYSRSRRCGPIPRCRCIHCF